METCHECAEVVSKLNEEFEKIYNEKELYKSMLKDKHNLVIDIIKQEYTKLKEVRKDKDKINQDDNMKEYNLSIHKERNIQNFILELCKTI
tara:strand:- start:171 stop:443 length:273 start_codon:yes stop_codon:yes gene_type:complete